MRPSCDLLDWNWFVDPRHGGQLGRLRSAVAEPGRVGGVGGVEGLGPLGADLGGRAVVDRGRRVVADARVPVLVVVVGEERLAERPGVLDAAEALGEGRAVLEGLELRLAVGVVVLTCGRLWVRPMPRNVSSSVTGFDVIDDPRSAWMVSWSGGTWWRATASAMSSLASSPDSVGATHQATT